MATYRVDCAAQAGRPQTLFRGVVLCESCFEALGAVQAAANLTGMSQRLAIAMWPELEQPIRRHEEQCRKK